MGTNVIKNIAKYSKIVGNPARILWTLKYPS
jgi:hypothetical protein